MSEFLDGELPAPQFRQVEQHLAQCASCAAELQAWQHANRLVTDHMPSLDPPAALWAGISHRITLAERPPSLLEQLTRQWKMAFAVGAAVVVALTLVLVIVSSSPGAGISEDLVQAQMDQYLRDRGHHQRAANPFSEDEAPAAADSTENPFSRYIRLEYHNPFEEMK
jgi:anti-sigma factor RsiW